MPVDKEAARTIARKAKKLAKKDLLDLAGKENISHPQQGATRKSGIKPDKV